MAAACLALPVAARFLCTGPGTVNLTSITWRANNGLTAAKRAKKEPANRLVAVRGRGGLTRRFPAINVWQFHQDLALRQWDSPQPHIAKREPEECEIVAPTHPSMAPCSPPSRRGLEAPSKDLVQIDGQP